MKHITQSKEWNTKNMAEKGFTLVELLVVIAILGILAVVGVLAFGGLTDSAKKATADTEKAQVQTAVDAFLAKDATNTVAEITDVSGNADAAKMATEKVLKAGTTFQCTYVVSGTGNVTLAAAQPTTCGATTTP